MRLLLWGLNDLRASAMQALLSIANCPQVISFLFNSIEPTTSRTSRKICKHPAPAMTVGFEAAAKLVRQTTRCDSMRTRLISKT
jgi:hypothetical protein